MRERSPKPPARSRSARESAPADVKIELVSFRNGEAVHQHPSLQSWLENGWQIRSAVPRIVESGDTMLLVVLERSAPAPKPSRSPVSKRMRALRE